MTNMVYRTCTRWRWLWQDRRRCSKLRR